MKKFEEILIKGADFWNSWRKDNPSEKIKFRYFRFRDMNLDHIDFSGVDLATCRFLNSSFKDSNFKDSNLRDTVFKNSKFQDSNFDKAIISKADLSGGNFENCSFDNATFSGSVIAGANFKNAKLTNVNLRTTRILFSDFRGTQIVNAKIYGISAWDLLFDENTIQEDLVIDRKELNGVITVDNLEIAQFIYLIYSNEKIRDLIDTLTTKAVLILGRFTEERKKTLLYLKEELRNNDYVPILFDFTKPENRDYIETVLAIAHLSKFVIADLSDARIVLEELPHIARNLTIPIKPILLKEQYEPITLYNLRRNHKTILETLVYSTDEEIHSRFQVEVVNECEKMFDELIRDKSKII